MRLNRSETGPMTDLNAVDWDAIVAEIPAEELEKLDIKGQVARVMRDGHKQQDRVYATDHGRWNWTKATVAEGGLRVKCAVCGWLAGEDCDGSLDALGQQAQFHEQDVRVNGVGFGEHPKGAGALS